MSWNKKAQFGMVLGTGLLFVLLVIGLSMATKIVNDVDSSLGVYTNSSNITSSGLNMLQQLGSLLPMVSMLFVGGVLFFVIKQVKD